MLRKLYLVSPEKLNTVTSYNSNTPSPTNPAAEMIGKKQFGGKRRRRRFVKPRRERERDKWVTKRSAARSGDYDKWFKVRGKLHEADVERKNQIKTVDEFLKQVLPASPSSAPRDASHSDTQTEHGPP